MIRGEKMNEKLKSLGFFVECDKCGTKTDCTNVNLAEEIKLDDGRIIYLTWYDCPKCGKRHYTQIDTKQTRQMVRSLSLSMGKSIGKYLENKHVPKSMKQKYDRVTKQLQGLRYELMKEFEGKTITHNGAEVEIHFSV